MRSLLDDLGVARKAKKLQRGTRTRREKPIWEPLLELAPEDIDDFMWMGEIEVTDGARVQMYKHYWTRRYIHLDLGGRAFVYLEPDRYEEVDAEWVLPHVCAYREIRASIVRRNELTARTSAGLDRRPSIGWHGIDHFSSFSTLASFSEGDGWEYESARVAFLGSDPDGERLAVIAATPESGELVILHAMPMRERYGRKYVEAISWRV